MKKRPPFNFEEHEAIADQLYWIRDYLLSLGVDLGARYAQASPAVKKAGRACGVVDELRSALDDLLCKEYPDRFDARIYYPGDQYSSLRIDEGPRVLSGGSTLGAHTRWDYGRRWLSVTLNRETRPARFDHGPPSYGTSDDMAYLADCIKAHAASRCLSLGYEGSLFLSGIRDIWNVTAPYPDAKMVLDALVGLDRGDGTAAATPYLRTPCNWDRCSVEELHKDSLAPTDAVLSHVRTAHTNTGRIPAELTKAERARIAERDLRDERLRLDDNTAVRMFLIDAEYPQSFLVVEPTSPTYLRNVAERIGRQFRRECNYDFPPYSADNPGRSRVVLIGGHEAAGHFVAAGAVGFDPAATRQRQRGDGRQWVLTWIWLHPQARGRLTVDRIWPDLESIFGDFGVESPYRPAAQCLLRRLNIPCSRLDFCICGSCEKRGNDA